MGGTLTTFFSTALIMLTTFTLMSYSGRLSIRRRCPFAIRAVPIPAHVMGNRAIRIHYRLGHRNQFSSTHCAVHCFRPSNGNALQVSSKVILLPGSHCPLSERMFHLCCASRYRSQRAVSVCFRSGDRPTRLFRLDFDFGGRARSKSATTVSSTERGPIIVIKRWANPTCRGGDGGIYNIFHYNLFFKDTFAN